MTDSQAHTATATVTVNAALSISPAAPTLAPSAGQTFTAAGGVAPYSFSLLSGFGSINSETGAYTAYPSPGLATIRVRDGLGNTADAAVTIVEPLSLSPGTISLLKGSGIVFSARGGLAPYSYAVKTGQGSVNSATGAYTAPNAAGTATIEVTDSLGTKAESAVTIYDGLTILPFTKTLVVNQVFSFSAAGGIAPYTYSVASGGGSITVSSGAYTAPATAGSATVRVTDSGGNTSEAVVTIRAALTISPTTQALAVNNSATFTGSGGIPPYTFSIAAGSGTISGTTGEYTAPAINGSATIRVTDSDESFAEATVTIEPALAISPLTPFVAASGSQTFSSTGGVGAKTYSLRSGPGSINATSGSYSAPASAGSAVVRVTDSLGNFAETTITTYTPLALTPAAAAVAVGNSVSFTATGGVLPYVMQISAGGGTLSAGGIYTAPGASGSATVRVTDALGTPVEAPITISNALSISPASKTLLVNGTHTFTASGGVAPYTYSVIEGGGTVDALGFYTAPATAGSAFLRVTDSLGNTSDAAITINPALTLSPSTVTLAVNNTATFTASGGIGSYTYSVSSGAGTGTINATNGLFTAPASVPPGNTATVRVTDSESHTAEATVTINAALSISPTMPTVAAGGTQTFTASGGVPGYTFSKPTGSGSMGGAVYTAPSVNTGTTATIRVTDSKDNSAETTITVPAITVSITSPSGGATVNVANQAALTVSGACSESTRTVTVSAGTVTASPTCSGGNTWSTTLDLSSLSDSAISITANHSNVNSVAAAEASVSVNKDGTAPTSVAITTPTASAYVNAANTSAFTISGTCSEPGTDNVTVKAGATTLGTASCSGTTFSGSFDLSAQAEGAVSLTAILSDAAANSTTSSAVSITKDTVAPTTPASLSDGTWSKVLNASTALSWAASTDSGSGVAGYDLAIGTAAGETQALDWTDAGTATTKTQAGLALSDATTYYASVRARDNAGNVSTVTSSNGWTTDATAPSAPASMDDGTETFLASDAPVATWGVSNDSGSGLDHYELAIGTSAGGNQTLDWTPVGVVTSGSLTGLSLSNGITYYTNVRASDVAGNTSSVTAGNGWVVQSGFTYVETSNHTCAIRTNGALYCWGANAYGQVGDGTRDARTTPYQVFASGVTAVRLSGNHTCAIKTDGALYCWGYNANGQIGNNSTTDQLAPLQIIASGVTDAKTGSDHTCAIVNTSLRCWGANGSGQIGNNSTTEQRTPLQIFASGVTQIAIGQWYTCAIVSGALQCWGYNSNGQIGNNSTVNRLTPAVVIASGVTALATGAFHACAIANTHLYCWGQNTYGQVGNNSTTDRLTPALIISGASGISAVGLGSQTSCAIVNNALQCWGRNDSGAVGNNSTSNQLTPTEVLPSGVSKLRSTFNSSPCAIVEGALYCWGYNQNGNVGNGTTTNSLLPFRTVDAEVTQISDGNGGQRCAIVDYLLYCWGYNSLGGVGDGTGGPRFVPTLVPALSEMVTPSIRTAEHACAFDASGALYCWGPNTYGQIGDGTKGNRYAPYLVFASGTSDAVLKYERTCAIVSGALYCWGKNTYGELGDGSTTDRTTPTLIIASDVTAVALGGNHTCAIVSGALKCWGRNYAGQVGNGSTTDQTSPVQVLASGVSSVSLGENHSCANQLSNVYCWGLNGNKQLGDTTTTNRPAPTLIVSGASVLEAGSNHNCAITSGSLKCWGQNSGGRVGNGTSTDVSSPTVVLANATSVSLGQSHTCATVTTGAAYCWGSNSYGQIGNNTTTNQLSPVQVIASGMNSVKVTNSLSCARSTSGALRCWGANSSGQVGDGTSTNALVPVEAASAGVTQFAPGSSFTCAIIDGKVSCWGANYSGQVGDGTGAVLTPVLITP
ncbi:MAG: hypothetical protein NDJ90_08785 [Oligoflexia bacterium]|nr:hypothetical protein [Oligoflexia bacterium]